MSRRPTWRTRLQRATAWGQWLLQEVLASASAVAPWVGRAGVRRILLIDGTHLKCGGAQGLVWRVHTAFDLLAGRLTQLKVTDTHEAEHLEVFELRQGDVVITDRANGYRERIAYVVQQEADLVVRFSPATLPLEEEEGRVIDVVRWLKGRRAPAGRVYSRLVWISHQGRRIALRLVAVRLSAGQREAAQRKKKRAASKQQRKTQADTLYLAGWVLLVTTLPGEQWSAQQVAALYQARWHIEDYHQCLKTGCQIEARQVQTYDALRTMLGFLAPLAVRLLQVREVARQEPERLAQEVLPSEVVQVVAHLAHIAPERLTSRRCWHRIAQAGGYLGRKGDGEPGWKTLWKGWLYIQTLLEGIHLAAELSLE